VPTLLILPQGLVTAGRSLPKVALRLVTFLVNRPKSLQAIRDSGGTHFDG
jgi:hypothetical protein